MVLPTNRSITNTRAEHVTDHNLIATLFGKISDVTFFGAIGDGVADDTVAIQAALDDLANGDNLHFPPGTYNVSSPLTLTSMSRVHITGNGATLHATATMSSILSLNGFAYSVVEGLWFDSDGDVTVTDMLYYHWDGIVARSSTRNIFRNMHWEGRFVTALRIGQAASGVQTDNSLFESLAIGGGWTTGEGTLWQEGIHVGDAVSGNNMLHNIRNSTITHCAVAVFIDRSRICDLEKISTSLCGVDYDVQSPDSVRIMGCRSENAEMFLEAIVAGTTFGAKVTVDNCIFKPGSNFNIGDIFIDFRIGGTLHVVDTVVASLPVATIPLIQTNNVASKARQTRVRVEGYRVSTDTTITGGDDLFDVDVRTDIIMRDFERTTAAGALVDADAIQSYSVTDGV